MKSYLYSLITLLFLVFLLLLIPRTYAGDVFAPPPPNVSADPVFLDNELQIDLFGGYLEGAYSQSADGWGGGLGVNYFFTRILGVGVDGGYYEDGDDGNVWDVGASLILRAPIEPLSVAPYAYGGVSGSFIDTATANFDEFGPHVGAGLDWRWTDTVGAFVDWRYTFLEDSADSRLLRLGLKFVF